MSDAREKLLRLLEFIYDDSDMTRDEVRAELVEMGIDPDAAAARLTERIAPMIAAAEARIKQEAEIARLKAERDAVLVAGAVQVHAAREAFVAFRGAVEGVAPELPRAAFERLLGALERANAALSRLDGGGDVREWARKLYFAGIRYAEGLSGGGTAVAGSSAAVEDALASPPALPDAEAVLAEFLGRAFREARAWEAVHKIPPADLNLARRWLGGER